MGTGNRLWWAAAALLLFACGRPAEKPLMRDAGTWPQDLRRIALVELSFDRRYRPPAQSFLVSDLRQALRRELAGRGYRLLLADRGEEIYRGETAATELAARAPAVAEAALALHIDFLFLPATAGEVNPPPEVEIAGEARLIDTRSGRPLWRDRGSGLAGGGSAMALTSLDSLRRMALADLATELFATLPATGNR